MFLPESPNNGQWLVAIQSVTYPTRLETWTKESNMCASHWEAVNLRGKWKWRRACRVSVRSRRRRRFGGVVVARTTVPSRPQETLHSTYTKSDVYTIHKLDNIILYWTLVQ